jgi:hypothetical protein
VIPCRHRHYRSRLFDTISCDKAVDLVDFAVATASGIVITSYLILTINFHLLSSSRKADYLALPAAITLGISDQFSNRDHELRLTARSLRRLIALTGDVAWSVNAPKSFSGASE